MVGATLLLLAAANPARAAPFAIWLEIGGDPSDGDESAPPAGTILWLNGLAARERRDLAAALARWADDLERRKNPLYTPLDDEGMRQEMRSLVGRTRPARAAAAALAAGRWRTADGDLTARAVVRCAPGVRCRSLTADATGDGLARRLRFLVWPLGAALVVEGRDEADAALIADRLRAGEAADSRIALVLAAADLHRCRRDRETKRLVRAAARVANLAKRATETVTKTASPELVELLEAIAHPPAGDEMTWLRLPPAAVLVVPRLGALATPAAVLAEVRDRLAGHRATVARLASGTGL